MRPTIAVNQKHPACRNYISCILSQTLLLLSRSGKRVQWVAPTSQRDKVVCRSLGLVGRGAANRPGHHQAQQMAAQQCHAVGGGRNSEGWGNPRPSLLPPPITPPAVSPGQSSSEIPLLGEPLFPPDAETRRSPNHAAAHPQNANRQRQQAQALMDQGPVGEYTGARGFYRGTPQHLQRAGHNEG